jgi:hypothetical protein
MPVKELRFLLGCLTSKGGSLAAAGATWVSKNSAGAAWPAGSAPRLAERVLSCAIITNATNQKWPEPTTPPAGSGLGLDLALAARSRGFASGRRWRSSRWSSAGWGSSWFLGRPVRDAALRRVARARSSPKLAPAHEVWACYYCGTIVDARAAHVASRWLLFSPIF